MTFYLYTASRSVRGEQFEYFWSFLRMYTAPHIWMSLCIFGYCWSLSKPLMDISFSKFSFYTFDQLMFVPTVQFSSVAQSCPILCDPMNHITPSPPVHHQLPQFTQTHVHRVGDAIQPSHPLSSPSPHAPNPSQHQSLFQWVNSSHEVAKVLEFQL